MFVNAMMGQAIGHQQKRWRRLERRGEDRRENQSRAASMREKNLLEN
jgi:hypothetical protein